MKIKRNSNRHGYVGKAINGYKSLFNLVKKFVKYNFANIAWDNIKEIKVDKIPTEIDK